MTLLATLLLLVAGPALARPAIKSTDPNDAAMTPALWTGSWAFEQKQVLITITNGKPGLDIAIEVPDAIQGGRRTMLCEHPTLATLGAILCSIDHPNGPNSDAMKFVLTPVDTDHFTLAPEGVAFTQTAVRVDTSAPNWRANLEDGWRAAMLAEELEPTINSIKLQELAYDAAFDEFIAADAAPRAVTALTPEAVAWVGNPRFDRLGWRPDGPVAGCYEVHVTRSEDGRAHFQVDGWLDADGDGVPAHWMATEETNATRVSAEGVK